MPKRLLLMGTFVVAGLVVGSVALANQGSKQPAHPATSRPVSAPHSTLVPPTAIPGRQLPPVTATTAPLPAPAHSTIPPTTAPPPAPTAIAPTTTQALPSSTGPSNGGGDGDADNFGGPSDGDGMQ
jgi:hypothetical protein